MKKNTLKVVGLTLLIAIVTSGCGSYSSGFGYTESINNTAGSMMYDGFTMDSSSYDYSTTSITGDYSEYKYTFGAEGATKKSREEMLKHFEEIQDIADSNGGYIENVDNSYSLYLIDYRDTYMSYSEKNYKYSGNLRFTVQIPPENIQLIIDYLTKFCKDNNFDVTRFNQYIYNYKGKTIVDNYEDVEYWERGDKITQEDLDKRLKYAEFNITISYYNPRSGFSSFAIKALEIWNEFWDSIGEVVMAFISIAIGALVLFVEAIFLARLWKRASYKYKLKKPEYHQPKEVIVMQKENDESGY